MVRPRSLHGALSRVLAIPIDRAALSGGAGVVDVWGRCLAAIGVRQRADVSHGSQAGGQHLPRRRMIVRAHLPRSVSYRQLRAGNVADARKLSVLHRYVARAPVAL